MAGFGEVGGEENITAGHNLIHHVKGVSCGQVSLHVIVAKL